jgi:outer membrane biosynthesis protein TonB
MQNIQIEEVNEKRNSRIGLLVSLLIHGLLVLLCVFALAWKRQIPPPPEYGMEVNFGLDDQGFGDVQNFNPPGEEPSPQQNQSTPAEPQEQNQTESQPEAEPEKIITGVEETVNLETPKNEPKKTEVAPVQNPNPAKKPSAESLFPSEKQGNANNNNGNKPGTVGDMGNPKGDPDVRGIYEGNPGKGRGGSSLDMAGWRWDSKPSVNDESDEEGKIVFQIKVDGDGTIISVNVLEKTVSPAIVQKYRREVESLTFSRTAGGNDGEGATGRITFIITSK